MKRQRPKQVSITLRDEIRTKIEKIAQHEGRSFSNMAGECIRRYFYKIESAYPDKS
jgi:predicted transcriptional regulator